MLVLIFSTREALKEAKKRQRELELEIKEVILTGFQQKEEEIKRVREWLKEQQVIQLVGVKASEQILRYPKKKKSFFIFFLFFVFSTFAKVVTFLPFSLTL